MLLCSGASLAAADMQGESALYVAAHRGEGGEAARDGLVEQQLLVHHRLQVIADGFAPLLLGAQPLGEPLHKAGQSRSPYLDLPDPTDHRIAIGLTAANTRRNGGKSQ